MHTGQGAGEPLARRALLESRRAFWLVNAAAWAAYGLVTFLAALPLASMPAGTVLGFKIGWAAAGFVVSIALRAFLVRYAHVRRTRAQRAGMAILASAVAAPVWLLVHRIAAELATGGNAALIEWAFVPRLLADHFSTLLIWCAAFLAATEWRRANERERAVAEGKALAHEAQLETLRHQLNPHFLFNALTSIRALVLTDPPTAHRMITEFAELLRASLRRPASAHAPLAAEVEMSRRYLAVEAMRFGGSLEVSFDIPAATRHCVVPEFILQPLVENAIKHGSPGRAGSLIVRVSAATVGENLVVDVTNTGHLGATNGASKPNSRIWSDHAGLGLRIVRARLAAEYPTRHEFTLVQDGEHVRARIVLPVHGG